VGVSEDAEGNKLIDSGNKCKLEEVGGVRIARSEPRAWWKTALGGEEWKKAEAYFGKEKEGRWVFKKPVQLTASREIEKEFVVDVFDGIKAKIKFGGSSKHIGIFPEQITEWKWIKEKIASSKHPVAREMSVLNLFGYTGIASLVAAKGGLSREDSLKWGVKVTHVDASKQAVDWARENQKLSGLENAPIRWIVDDVLKFLKKEIGRGAKYDVIIMDPPSYGKGPKGEVWKIEEKLPELLENCKKLLSDDPLFIIFNMYSTELSSISVANILSDITKTLGGHIESGELAIKEQGSSRLLPLSIFAIWER
jgi:23S rRNA (cytosine1962-C5)-methyltransferase